MAAGSFKRALVLLAPLVLVAGCSSGANVLQMDARSKTNDRRIYDSGLQSDAEIVTGKPMYSELIMVAFVELQSHVSQTQKLYYRFTWYDQDGFQQGGRTRIRTGRGTPSFTGRVSSQRIVGVGDSSGSAALFARRSG